MSTTQLSNCLICLAPNTAPCVLSPCGHAYCIECIISFIRSRCTQACPLCSAKFTHVMPVTNLTNGFEGKDHLVVQLRELLKPLITTHTPTIRQVDFLQFGEVVAIDNRDIQIGVPIVLYEYNPVMPPSPHPQRHSYWRLIKHCMRIQFNQLLDGWG